MSEAIKFAAESLKAALKEADVLGYYEGDVNLLLEQALKACQEEAIDE